MAIWDDAIKEKKENSSIFSSSADTHKCPGCAGNLLFDQESQKLLCNSCGKSYFPEYFEISELLNRTVNEEFQEDDNEFSKHEIICNACGAAVVADINTVSTFCAFCGSPALITSRLTKSFEPKYIIPFKVKKEEAQKIFVDWTSNKRFIPSNFTSKATLEKITGLYVPFWLIDADCDINLEAGAHKTSKDLIRNFEIKRTGKFRMRGVPFDGSKKINDVLMERIEPFDYCELTEYKSGYLPGYYAERYDDSIEDLSERISERFRYYAKEERDSFISKSRFDSYNIDKDESTSSNYVCNYALFPVWFLNYEFEGIRYKIAVNGQTGKIHGEVPIDDKKRKLVKFLHYLWGYTKMALACFIIGLILSVLFMIRDADNISFASAFETTMILFFVEIIPMIICSIFLSDNDGWKVIFEFFIKKIQDDVDSIDEEIAKMPPARTYIDSTDRVIINEEDKELIPTISIQTPREDENNFYM